MKNLFNLPMCTNYGKTMPISRINAGIVLKFLGPDIFNNLSLAYFNLLDAIQQNDQQFIRTITQKKYADFLIRKIQTINNNDLKIHQTPHKSQLINGQINMRKSQMPTPARPIWHAEQIQFNLNFSAHIGLSYETRDEANIRYKFNLLNKQRYFYIKNFAQVFNDFFNRQLIVIHVNYISSRKLFIKNAVNQIVEGSDKQDEWIRSLVRFETNSQDLKYYITDINNQIYDDYEIIPKAVKQF